MKSEHLNDDRTQAWAEGSLSPEEATKAEAHLAGCPSCRDSADGYRAMFASLERDVPPTPPELFKEVMEAVAGGGQARPERLPAVLKIAAVGTAAAVLVVIFGLFDLQNEGMNLVPALSTEIADLVPEDLHVPPVVNRAVLGALNRAEGEWMGMVALAEKAIESRRALSPPALIALALMGLLNIAALWRLREN